MSRSAGRALVALYPPSFRERWGHELADEADGIGWSAVLELAFGIVGMWLHPAIWPASSVAERRRRVATLAVLVTAVGWLTAHAVLELTGAVPRALAHSWLLMACDFTTFAGFLMAAPFPRFRRTSIARLAVLVGRRLAVPAGAAALIVYVANAAVAPDPVTRVVVVSGWWLALMFGAAQAVRTLADVGVSDVSMPGPSRLRLGLWLTGIGLTGTGVTILTPALAGNGDSIAGLLGGAALLALAASVRGTIRDLAEVRIG